MKNQTGTKFSKKCIMCEEYIKEGDQFYIVKHGRREMDGDWSIASANKTICCKCISFSGNMEGLWDIWDKTKLFVEGLRG